MGDMADYVNELIEQEYEDLYKFRRGEMSVEEAMDRGVCDEYGAEYYTYNRSKCCKYCSQGGLEWGQLDNGAWRLFEPDGSIHSCINYKNSK